MNKLSHLIIALLLILSVFSCNKSPQKKDWYIISKNDSIDAAQKNPIPPPRLPEHLKWYSNIVFIIDSTKIYIYQTKKVSDYARNISKSPFPNYIGLMPEYLLTIDSDNFTSFIKDNNDILEIYSKPKKRINFFYIASIYDTIKNPAFYELEKIADDDDTFYKIRRTTEEENVVVQHKRNKLNFVPEKIVWTSKFLNGKHSPFTKEYYVEENNTQETRSAIEIFQRISFAELVDM